MATVAQALSIALDLMTAGRTAEARELLGRILDAADDQADAHHLLGLLESGEGAHARAAARLRLAVALAPGRVDYAHNFAKALLAAGGDVETAGRAAKRAARLTPMNAEWPLYVALLAESRGDHAETAAAARHLLALQPDLADAWRRGGTALHALRDFAAAQAALTRFARLRPGEADGWTTTGAAARAADDQPAAAAAFRRALVLDPARLDALATLGNALKDIGDLAAAATVQRRAVRLSGDDPTMIWNYALTLLSAGRYAEGWPALESRWRAEGFPTRRRDFAAPQWRGEDVAGRTVLLYEEQGRGDAVQFIRYAALTAARGARVIVEVGADLVALFRRSLDGVAEVIESGGPPPALDPAADYVCPLMSLPLAFATTVETIPARVPYLHPDPDKAAAWRKRLRGDGPAVGPAVGIVWAGNPAFADDRRRSPGLKPLTPLFAVPGVRWFGLRTGPAPYPRFTDLSPEITDFADTAAIMAGLDLVITSCTAAAHLAGASGRPTWVLLPHAADWRWLRDRDDSPWYPTARLFRQPRAGDWDAVAAAAARALTAFAANGEGNGQ